MKFNWRSLFADRSENKPEPYIHLEPAQVDTLRQIKAAVGHAETETAIKLLGTLNIPGIENEITALSGRYFALKTDQVRGVLSNEAYNIQLNRIHSDVLSLVALLGKNLEPEQIICQIKALLRERYRKYLTDKLADRQPINIQCAYSIEGTDLEHAKIAYDEIVLEQQAVQSNLENLFDRHRGRLLIIGEPGSGKTSLLLQLADALLQRRENRVPVILNLSTWKNTYKTFDAWLLETLPAAASISRAMAKSLVREDRLLPLFDGLDELAPEHRNSCLEGIAQYGRRADHQYVICSRTAEYAGTSGAPVYGQIKLLPLTQAQIIGQLENSAQPEARFLLAALQHQPVLAKVVENPFYFNTAQLLLASMKSLDELHIHTENEERLKAALVDHFIVRQLQTPERIDFPADKSRKWLGFLAKNMQEKHLARFEMADLKLGWVREKWIYYLVGVITYGIGIFFTQNEKWDWATWPLISIVWVVFSSGNFRTYSGITWRYLVLKNNLIKTYAALTIGLALNLIDIYVLSTHMEGIKWLSIFEMLLRPFSLFLIFDKSFICMIIFLATMLVINRNHIELTLLSYLFIVFVIRFVKSGLQNKNVSNLSSPYKRIFLSFNIELFYALLFICLMVFFKIAMPNPSGIQANNYEYVFSWLFIFLPFSLLYKHFLIRIICSFRNNLPFRLVDFLNEMAARHLFESDGGSWRFRHRILQDYFLEVGAE